MHNLKLLSRAIASKICLSCAADAFPNTGMYDGDNDSGLALPATNVHSALSLNKLQLNECTFHC